MQLQVHLLQGLAAAHDGVHHVALLQVGEQFLDLARAEGGGHHLRLAAVVGEDRHVGVGDLAHLVRVLVVDGEAGDEEALQDLVGGERHGDGIEQPLVLLPKPVA